MIYRQFISQALREASNIAKEKFGKVKPTVKPEDNNQVLTEADLLIGRTLVGSIRKNYPTHNIIDEESGLVDNKSEFTWIIDPIDGTSNFAAGVPSYGILLGLLKNNTPIAGGMVLPAYNEIYYAEKNHGAYLNNNKIKVTAESKLSNILLAYGIDGYKDNPSITKKECDLLSKIIINIRSLRSSNSAYDAAMLAKGSYGAMLNQTSKIWDNVAPQIIIEEAGGLYTDFNGYPIDYSDPLSKANKNFKFVAAPPILHKQITEIITTTF